MPRNRRLAAIMFTDIQGYTALMQASEEKAIAARDKHRRVFQRCMREHNGEVIQYFGDGTLSVFASTVDAVRCGIDLQHGFLAGEPIPVRIGIHSGEVVFADDDILGDSVNVASRIESLGIAGSVVVSARVFEEVQNQGSIDAIPMGAFQLKNVTSPVQIYAISNEGLTVPPSGDVLSKEKLVAGAADSGVAVAAVDSGSLAAIENGTRPDDQHGRPQAGRHEALLATKFHIPAPRHEVVKRPDLIRRLLDGLDGDITIVTAPAGFGKTTAITEMLGACERPAAWLSLDERDAEPTRFLSYLVGALRSALPDVGKRAADLLDTAPPPPPDAILTELLADLAAADDLPVLVLDDYHLVDSDAINDVVAFLIAHLPPGMHVVLTSRRAPGIRLSRLRAQGRLTELDATDLRFRTEDAARFLQLVMGLHLSADDVARLEESTEGWIAGLQMAALSMRGRSDPGSVVASFSGDQKFILDYLLEEVLEGQPEEIRQFLLDTAILEQLSGPLCDAVVEGSGGAAKLEAIERANLFLVPLDDERGWYRYHHLFADVLRTRLAKLEPGRTATLHARAADWFERKGSPSEAIRHALASGDEGHAADMIERAWPAMDESFQSAAWLKWAQQLSDDVVRCRPVLSVAYAWALLNAGDLEGGELRVRNAEQWLDLDQSGKGLASRPAKESTAGASDLEVTPIEQIDSADEGRSRSHTGMIVADATAFRYLPGSTQTVRAYIAQARGDGKSTLLHARKAIGLLPEDDHTRRGPAAALLGLASWSQGNLDEAYEALTTSLGNFRKSGNAAFSISGTSGLVDIRMAQGRLPAAFEVVEEALEYARGEGGPPLAGTADLYLLLAELHHERGDSIAAEEYYNQSKRLALRQAAALPTWNYRAPLLRARMQEAAGNYEAASDELDEAERQFFDSPIPNVRPFEALQARLRERSGEHVDSQAFASERRISVDDELSYIREFEHITLARLLIADETPTLRADGKRLLSRLLESAEAGGRHGVTLEIRLLQAIVAAEEGDTTTAHDRIEQVLKAAEAEGFERTMLDEGERVRTLLGEVRATTER